MPQNKTNNPTGIFHPKNRYFKYFLVMIVIQSLLSINSPLSFILDGAISCFFILWIMDLIRWRGGIERKENKKVRIAIKVVFLILPLLLTLLLIAQLN